MSRHKRLGEDLEQDIRNHLVDEQTRGQLESWVETELVKQHDVETMY